MIYEKFVFTNGCFDILHRGHVELLQYCKSLGYVIVGLNSDESIRRLKGRNRPVNNQNDRRDVLLALRCVDAVVIFDEDTPYQLIQRLAPDIIVKGGDYQPEDVVGRDIAPVRIFNIVPGYSTTSLIQRASNR
jgi:rfaE bifunctional protein nucleotidyltransferase chain/domain